MSLNAHTQARERRNRYAALTAVLRDMPGSEAAFTFREIERLIGASLPSSARHRRNWWANQVYDCSARQCRTWMEVGWRVERVDLAGERVTFTRRQQD